MDTERFYMAGLRPYLVVSEGPAGARVLECCKSLQEAKATLGSARFGRANGAIRIVRVVRETDPPPSQGGARGPSPEPPLAFQGPKALEALESRMPAWASRSEWHRHGIGLLEAEYQGTGWAVTALVEFV